MRARRLTVGLEHAFCVFCAFCLGACALLAPSRPEALKIAPAVLGERTVEQRLVIRWPGGERSMEAALEIAEGRLRLVMLAFGMRLASLEYYGDGETLREQHYVPHAPEGARILNDLLMISAPLEDLRRALPPKLDVNDSRINDRLRREIVKDGVVQVVIDYETDSPWQGKVTFSNRAGHYELLLESHEF
jgi:hypothetical protein